VDIKVEMSQVIKLDAELAATSAVVAERVSAAIAKTAFDIEADSKALCPVDTGFLRGSISSSVEPLEAEIGPTAEYGAYVEYGTSRAGPQPYMTPSFDRRSSSLISAIEQAAGDIL
jgi:HK97 gp10 family phage protein